MTHFSLLKNTLNKYVTIFILEKRIAFVFNKGNCRYHLDAEMILDTVINHHEPRKSFIL